MLWDPDVRETKAQVKERARKVLNMIFEHDEPCEFVKLKSRYVFVEHRSSVVSITAHGGIINAFLAAVGRPPYILPTGGRCSR